MDRCHSCAQALSSRDCPEADLYCDRCGTGYCFACMGDSDDPIPGDFVLCEFCYQDDNDKAKANTTECLTINTEGILIRSKTLLAIIEPGELNDLEN